MHEGQTRQGGDPYITHPVRVATILVPLGADDQTLMVAELMALDHITGHRNATHAMEAIWSADARGVAMTLADRLAAATVSACPGAWDGQGSSGAEDSGGQPQPRRISPAMSLTGASG